MINQRILIGILILRPLKGWGFSNQGSTLRFGFSRGMLRNIGDLAVNQHWYSEVHVHKS